MFKLKRMLVYALSMSMLVPSVPMIAHGAGITNEWKFDFGYSDAVETGYIAVTPDMSYTTNTIDGLQFGFLGIDENSYSESGKWDGYSVAKGQQINLKSGGEKTASANDDFIAVPSKSEYLPENASAYEGRYPIRLKKKIEHIEKIL